LKIVAPMIAEDKCYFIFLLGTLGIHIFCMISTAQQIFLVVNCISSKPDNDCKLYQITMMTFWWSFGGMLIIGPMM